MATSKDRERAEKQLNYVGYRCKFVGLNLIVADYKEDVVYDILCEAEEEINFERLQ